MNRLTQSGVVMLLLTALVVGFVLVLIVYGHGNFGFPG